MADSRRTRDYQPNVPLSLQYRNDPQYIPLDQIGVSNGGPANEGLSLPVQIGDLNNMASWIPEGSGVKVDPRSLASGTVPAYVNPEDDALKGPLDQISEGLGKVGSALGSDVSSLGNNVMNGLRAIIPSQDTVNNIGMRLQNMGASYNGTTPLYMLQQQHALNMQNAQDLMAMKRQQLAQQLQQVQLQRQQKDEDQALRVWQDHQMPLSMKKKISQQMATQGNVLAGNLMRLGDDQIASELDGLRGFIPPDKLNQAIQMMKTPNADLSQVEQVIQLGRERKQAFGTAKAQSERFQELQSLRDQGQLPEDHPLYQEYAKSADELIKRKQEASERDLRLQQLGIGNQKAQIDLAAQKVMPQYTPEVDLPNGQVQRERFDPQTGQLSTVTGNKPPAMSVTNKIDMKTSESLAKPIGEIAQASHAKAMGAAQTVGTVNRIAQALDSKELNIGPTATLRSSINRYATLFGIEGKNTAERLSNTRSVIKGLAELALAGRGQLKGQGQVSDFEGKLLREAESGNIEDFTRDEMKSFIGVVDRVARNNYAQHQQLIKTMMENPEDARIARFYQVPALEPSYQYRQQASSPSTSIPQIQNEADYGKLPSGSVYIGPDGKKRKKQ